MYEITLAIHNLLRWVVLLLALVAVVRAFRGWLGGRAWTPSDERAGRSYVIAMDVQFLVGLVLYAFLSPVTANAMADMGAAMRDTVARFWAVEHLTTMLLALAAAHVARVRIRRRPTGEAKHRTAALLFTISLLILLAGIPWPFSRVARPWLPFGAS